MKLSEMMIPRLLKKICRNCYGFTHWWGNFGWVRDDMPDWYWDGHGSDLRYKVRRWK